MKTTRIAILASGSGSNAEQIVKAFSAEENIAVELILSNKSDAGVLQRASRLGIPAVVFDKSGFQDGNQLVEFFKTQKIDYLILAGFLLRIPSELVKAFADHILNIHPSLLPLYGGKGMYGLKVHQAVLDSGDRTTGITIHLVDENYDEGSVLFQAECPVLPGDTAETLADRVHLLEHEHYPQVIKRYILSRV